MAPIPLDNRLAYAQGIYPEASTVYLNSDLIFLILFYLDWPTLFRLSQASRDSRQLVRDEVRIRLRFFLGLFVTRDTYDGFMSMLRQVGGGILGGIPHLFLTAGTPFKPTPAQNLAAAVLVHRRKATNHPIQLQVLITGSGWDQACQWMTQQGYHEKTGLPINTVLSNVVSKTVSWSRPDSRRREYLVAIPCYIMLSCIETDLVNAALCAPHSCLTSLITGSTILSFFPQATNDRECLRRGSTAVHITHPPVHMFTCIHPHDIGHACGRKCPASPSRTRLPERVKSFSFIDDADKQLVQMASRSRKRHTYRPRCFNTQCSRFVPEYHDE
ncbi:hypothetical protein NMY22_g13794 [Coprinellus aureogranulatus]|nr:hypothetical protein NMY22_g13794 [Coprinellus aureogranulatus]